MSRSRIIRGLFLAVLFTLPSFAADYDLEKAQKFYAAGEYKKVIEQAAAAIEDRPRDEEWQLLYSKALWKTGEYPKAKDAIKLARRNTYVSIRVRLAAYHILRSNGMLEEAQEALEEINNLGGARRYSYRDPKDLVALGEAAVLLGADPKLVLDNFYNPVKKAAPDTRAVYLAIGHLALQKHDYALAGRAFQEGLQKFKEDAEMLAGLAEALEPGDRKQMIAVLEQILEINEEHIQARLLLAEHLIDAEEYEAAEKELARVESVNPNLPEMWAFRAVIAHLANDFEGEKTAREAGLKFWDKNPKVDSLIGRKLSQKYRFAEGSGYQRRALEFDRDYLPAKIQLAQDLMRLGHEEEGFRHANDVFRTDQYDVSAYNLVTLHDTMAKYAVLTNDHFVLRMSADEAKIYGEQALELLDRARADLTKKYDIQLETPTIVEIFPKQKDFAVRTFGMPGGDGYLGVCFGNVITANSPATHTMNWHSVLWHEFCHVVTLNLTKNKMPRWLSEGISVYEERRASVRWGEQINPQYREMIKEGEMKPIADLSSAFMAPPSGLHLQFAYYQSSLVVEFLIERFGLESIRAILKDLGEGKKINDALVAHSAPMEELEKDFAAFAEGVAENMGPDNVWSEPKDGRDPVWDSTHPENYWVIRRKVQKLFEEQKFEEAVPLLEELIRIYPGQSGVDSSYALLAEIHRKNKDVEKESEILRAWARLDGESVDALNRLIELDLARDDTESVLRHANMLLEIDPLQPAPHRAIAEAQEKLGKPEKAISSLRTVLALDPPNPSRVHYRLARLLHQTGDPKAKRHLLYALEDAPRFRDAHDLLLEVANTGPEFSAPNNR